MGRLKRIQLTNKNISLIQKICFSSLFISLAVILNKVVAINYISVVPFVRLSFGGPTIIIFSSILLGPIYGMFIGGISDILGYFIFDIRQFAYSPTITCIYIVLGFLAYFVFFFIRYFKNKLAIKIITFVSLFALFVGLSLFFILSSSFPLFGNDILIPLWAKITFPILLLVVLVLLMIGIFIIDKKREEKGKNKTTMYQVFLGSFILDLLVFCLFGSLMKSIMPFDFDLFPIILIFQCLTLFFNIFINTYLLTYLFDILDFFKVKGVIDINA